MPAERLQKIIAAAGVASRRKSEELITSGRVVVNGQVVTELGTKADPEQDHIRVDGKLLQGPERYIYVVLNKPKGYVTTVSDEKKRPTVMDLVGKVKGRVYPVGRLDWASEGLLLMTNDGTLANGLMKASSNVAKVYVVKVAGQPDETKLDKLRRGVSIAEKGGRRVRTAPAKIRLIREGDNPWLEVTIIEGRNRQVRKMFEEVGHHVEKIRRVQYGPLALDVPPGDWRNLTLLEVAKLKSAASGVKVASPPSPEISLLATKRTAIKPRPIPARANASKPFRSQGQGQERGQEQRNDQRPAQREKPSWGAKPPYSSRSSGPARTGKPSFGQRAPRPAQSEGREFTPSSRPSFKPKFKSTSRPSFAARSGKPSFAPRTPRPAQSERSSFQTPSEQSFQAPSKPSFQQKSGQQRSSQQRPAQQRSAPRSPRPVRSGKPSRGPSRGPKSSANRPFKAPNRKRD